MTLELELCIRLLGAGIIGAIIGYEREFRGKGAGVRTHVLVAMGACMLMMVSQYGFTDAVKFDAARVAASVVGGLGFLGGGIIMKNKHVTGLTTAAGIWVTGAIGLAMGCGMYGLALIFVVVVMVCMEAMHFYSFKLGDRDVNVTVKVPSVEALENAVKGLGKKVTHCSWTKDGDGYKADLTILVRKRDYPMGVLDAFRQLPNVELTSMD